MITENQFHQIYAKALKEDKNLYAHVDTRYGEVFVPRDCIDEDQSIYLWISPEAVRELVVKEETVHFRGKFGPSILAIRFPLENIIELVMEERSEV